MDASNIQWAVERNTFPPEEEFALLEVLRELGALTIVFGCRDQFQDSGVQLATIPRGSCHFVLQASRSATWRTDLWGDPSCFDCSSYYPRFDAFLLNRDFLVTSVNELCWTARDLAAEWNAPTLFVRPDDGFKSFAGGLVNVEEIGEWQSNLLIQQIRMHSKVLVAKPRRLLAEWRVQLVSGRAVAASEYRPDRRAGAPEDVLRFVEQVHRSTDWPVRAYVMDVARTEDGLAVVEIGSLLCTAFYRSDPRAIVEALHSMIEAS